MPKCNPGLFTLCPSLGIRSTKKEGIRFELAVAQA